MKKECYSTNEIEFYEEIEDLLSVNEVESIEQLDTIYVGEKVQKNHSDFIFASSLIEDMQNIIYDNHGEYAEGYIENIDIGLKEHKAGLEKVISDYMDEHFAKPNLFEVKNIKQITIDEFKNRTKQDK